MIYFGFLIHLSIIVLLCMDHKYTDLYVFKTSQTCTKNS